MRKTILALTLALGSGSALAANPDSGTITIHETSLEFSNGPIIGLNPTPFIADNVDLHCEPGLTCDRFMLTVDVPDNLSDVFPTAILRTRIEWTHPSGVPFEDYDFYAYDENENLIGSSTELNSTTSNPSEAIALRVNNGTNTIRLDILYFLVAGSSYVGTVEMDLGAPSDDADVEAFFAENPAALSFFISPDAPAPTAESNARAASQAGGGALGGALLAMLGLLFAVRRRSQH